MPGRIFIILAASFFSSQVLLAGEITKPASTDKAEIVSKNRAKRATAKSPDDEAIELVNKDSEVKHWLRLFKGTDGTSPNTQGRPAWRVEEHHGNIYLVHVLEDTPDRDVTFGFYDVNLKTKKVTKHQY